MYYIIAQELSSKFMHGSSVQISYRSDLHTSKFSDWLTGTKNNEASIYKY
jgi:hypothetical protein